MIHTDPSLSQPLAPNASFDLTLDDVQHVRSSEVRDERDWIERSGMPDPSSHQGADEALLGELLDLDQLTQCLVRLRRYQSLVFHMEPLNPGHPAVGNRFDRTSYKVDTASAWRALMQGSAQGLNRLLNQSARYSVHPYLWHFLNNFGDLDLGALSRWRFVDANEAMQWVIELNRRIEHLRADLRSPATACAVDNLNRGHRSNVVSLAEYLNGLFERHSRLLVIRLDVGYEQGLALNQHMALHGVVVSTRPERQFPSRRDPNTDRGGLVTANQLGLHRDQLLAFIRRTYGENFCGYAWKLEYGARKGYHYHLVLFFDGARLRKDVTIAMHIGEHWRTVITGGQGVYYNCNAPEVTYIHRCVGPLSWNSPQRRTGLAYLCAYLLKPDLYVRLELEPGQRIFGKGGLPKPAFQIRRGRPRNSALTPAPE